MNERLTIPEENVDWRTKGVWWPDGSVSLEGFAQRAGNLFTGPFTWPLMVLREPELTRNITALAAFTDQHGLAFAPHGKTSMAPALIQRQLDAGAWGVTAATANQVLAYRRFGVRRIVLANELLDTRALGWIAAELNRDPKFEFLFYTDSAEGVAAAASVADPAGRPLRVLVERGVAGGRTGCRDRAGLLAVADAVADAPGLELAGVAGYEGPVDGGADAVRAFLHDLRTDAAEIARVHGPERPVLSVGGSAWFDLVAEEFGGARDVWPLLRSGAYVAHDDGLYRRTTPYRRLDEGPGALAGALELWAQVTSTPEQGLAIAGLGRREANFDAGFPVPRTVRRPDGTRQPVEGLEIEGLNDHHAYLRVPPELELHPGDLVSFGISHPCTAFDRWALIPVVDAEDTVVEAVATYF
ncbi:alanine racemase [Nocardiopsis salina]|uniref:alanine racemase n=1 Tax=Nocardiopsis salina TaxID=245836 RepID=UPI00034C75D5|nr:alanine racemase [Nocardiopsis salina]